MEINTLTFNGQRVMDQVKKLIQKSFKTDEWYELFDNNDLEIITYQERVSDRFPIITINIIDDYPYLTSRDSNQISNHTQFSLRITIYNKNSISKKLNREIVSRKIADQIIYTLQSELGYIYESNQLVPNEDVDICRRIISYSLIIDNKTYNIYER